MGLPYVGPFKSESQSPEPCSSREREFTCAIRYIHACMCLHMHVCIHTEVHSFVYKTMHTYESTCIYIYIYMRAYIHLEHRYQTISVQEYHYGNKRSTTMHAFVLCLY